MPLLDTVVFLLHDDKYEVGDSTPGCMSHRCTTAVFMQRWADPWSLLNPLINGVEGTWDQFRMILKIILKKKSKKRQASSSKQRLTMAQG